MIAFLLLLPLLVLVSALSLYRQHGKREILKFDLVQFVMTFVVAPVLFIWVKFFVFYLLRNELNLHLSVTQLFVIDTAFSLLFLYIFAFMVIHSLTKSFRLKKMRDPLYDMFQHSEYFHLWLSHLIIFGGTIILISAFAFVNIFTPLPFVLNKVQFYLVIAAGGLIGFGTYVFTLLSDPLQGNFMRIMKLLFGVTFLSFVITYFMFDPNFGPEQVIYWMAFAMMLVLVLCSLFFQRSATMLRIVERLKDEHWGLNVDLFKK